MSNWWAQKLIVEYQQDRGLREPGERPGGTFAGGASKTVAARLSVNFAAAGGDKCQVAVEQERLPDAESAQRAKEAWRGRLTALRTMLQD